MNAHCIKPQFAADFGLFSAKFIAFWCKIRCILVQNTVRFGAKRSAFWYKTQGVLVLNARQNAAKCLTIRIKIRCNGTKKASSNHQK